MYPLSFAAKNGDNETYYLHEAIWQSDHEECIREIIKEIEDHRKNEHWRQVLKRTIDDSKTVTEMWSFKRKADQMHHF